MKFRLALYPSEEGVAVSVGGIVTSAGLTVEEFRKLLQARTPGVSRFRTGP